MEGIKKDHENLGELLSGDRIENSPYKINMKEDKFCEQLCYVKNNDIGKLKKAIEENYHNNWIVDNLPSASRVTTEASMVHTTYSHGFPIGMVDSKTKDVYINNHVNIVLEYHEVEGSNGSLDKEYRIVRFTVEPFSIKHDFTPNVNTDDDNNKKEGFTNSIATINNPVKSCDPTNNNMHTSFFNLYANNSRQMLNKGEAILFTYDVIWKENKEVSWASRWDIYLSTNVPNQIHWFTITNSVFIVVLLTIFVAVILVRNLKSDYERYSIVLDEEIDEVMEESGWKLVHADVFRPPAYPMVFSVICGSGSQLLLMSVLTICFAAMGFVNPSRRGSLIMSLLCLYVLMGSIAGFISARFYKSFNGKSYQKNTMATAFTFPTLFFSVFFLMNLIAHSKQSGDAVPFIRMIELLAIWFGVSSPLVFVGAFFGYKREGFEYPVSTSNLPRQIPDQPFYLKPLMTALFGGILPFGGCYLQIFFIFSSMWMDQYYYIFGFLFLTLLLVMVIVAEMAMVLNYIQLCREDYHWWWRSLINAGAFAFFVFGYAVIYFKELESNSLATYLLYFGYMTLISFALFLIFGGVGVFSCLWLNKKIFGAIKID